MSKCGPPLGEPIRTLRIPQIPVGLNGPGGLLRMHHIARTRYNHFWLLWVRCELDAPQIPVPVVHVVSIHQVRRRLLDPDNLVASCKTIIDALNHWGLICGDDAKRLDLIPPTQEQGRPGETVIKIWRRDPCPN